MNAVAGITGIMGGAPPPPNASPVGESSGGNNPSVRDKYNNNNIYQKAYQILGRELYPNENPYTVVANFQRTQQNSNGLSEGSKPPTSPGLPAFLQPGSGVFTAA